MRAKIVAVWGLHGRTTFAVNLAWMLTQTKTDKLVSLLSTNLTYGDVQNFFGIAIWDQHSLATALSTKGHARENLWKAGTERPFSDIFLMSLANDSDALLMESPSEEQCDNLVADLADEQSDYLVIDCSASISNPLSSVGLVHADVIICLHTPGTAAYQWFRSMRSFRQQLDLDAKTLHVIYAADRSANIGQYVDEAGITISAEVPFIRSASQYQNKGVPICAEASFDSRRYTNALKRICKLV